ncbi:hypothetical protein ACJMK2_012752 [Sinanodonta woodiana]|uniref:Transmembrane protein n=1 Tax=Sinanodonta woodiana TaxID=1069815 RepID=A0ABD3VC86_SINWO
MCLSMCCCVMEFLPYFCLVTIPLFGAFCGVDVILRVSLMIFAYILITQLIPKIMYYIIPYLNIGSLFIVMCLIPMNLIPYPVVWLYDKLLWYSDPLLQLIEVILALNFVMHCSKRATEMIEENEEEAWKWKMLLTVFSAFCYAMMVSLGLTIYKEGSNYQFWLLLFVICSSFMLAAHNMMWMSQEGIVSDVAFVSLCSMVAIYVMKEETDLLHHPLETPSSWRRYNRAQSVFSLGLAIINTTVGNASLAVQFLLKYLSPMFLVLLSVRLYSILFIIHRVIKKFELEPEKSFEEDVVSVALPWRSPVIVKFAIVFMVTQSTICLFYQCTSLAAEPSWWSATLDKIWPQDIVLGRILQIIMVNCFYIWRVYRSEDWEWSDWFSD